MRKVAQFDSTRTSRLWLLLLVPILCAFFFTNAQAFQLIVQNPDGALVSPYYWMVEEDNTNITVPGRQVPDGPPGATNTSIGIDIHNSYAPVVVKGLGEAGSITVTVPDPSKPYFVSVLPSGTALQPQPQYGMSGTTVAPGQAVVRVTVNPMPTPTAQIFMIAFVDHNPISNAKDEREDGLGGVSVYLYDFSGGKISVDAFGNPLGTTYQTDIFGNPHLDIEGNPVVDRLGDGALTTVSQADLNSGDPTRNPFNVKLGELVVKYLPPGKYGIRMVPPQKDDFDRPMNWVQTSTIEGTPTIDAWVQANEPRLFVEGFGTGVWHAMFGFVNYTSSDPINPNPWIVHGQTVTALQGNVLNDIGQFVGTGTITGTLRFNHFDKPPNVQGQHAGPPVDQCWVGLNDANLIAEPELVPIGTEPPEVIDALKPSSGLYVTQCGPDGSFTFENLPYLPQGYQIVTWDTPLDALFGFHNVIVPPGPSGTGGPVDLRDPNVGGNGPLLSFRWFGSLEGKVFYDSNQNGFPDSGETGWPGQAVLLRFRDGSVYQANATGGDGTYEFAEIFPFFKWLIVEVDFARFKATGATIAVDNGGPIADLYSPVWPSNGNKNLQPQSLADPFNVVPPGTVDYRVEQGPVLLEALQSFLNQTNLIDFGKTMYGPGENGGIAGIVFYDTTRAEDDPWYNFGEPWQPGIPRVQVNLYTDYVDNSTGSLPSDNIIDDRDGLNDGLGSTITLADVDNYPFGNFPGPEDIDRNYPGQTPGMFDLGDAVEVRWSDSWDDNKPSGCIQNLPSPYGFPIPECADAYGTWNQIRPGVFDGGYAFGPDIECADANCTVEADPTTGHVNQTVPGSGVGYLKAGNYIVEAAPPPHYLIGKSHDKNVDFGEIFIPGPLTLPPECVGDEYVVADYPPLGNFPGPEDGELSLFPGVPANLAGQTLNNCDRKAINLPSGGDANRAGVEFFMFTEVPKAARVVGFANNDLGAEFNQASPIYGEKLGVPWIPISFRMWNGIELFRVYADEWGNYNALLPSTYNINVPSPSGVGPNMITLVLNDPIKPDGSIDLWYNPDFSVTPWTFNYQPGTTTYTDTPMVPVTAFVTAETGLDTYQVDGGPVISQAYATNAGVGTGPLVCTDAPSTVTITSTGPTQILNPFWDPTAMTVTDRIITRDYGFGAQGPGSQVILDGVSLGSANIVSWNDAAIVVNIPAGLPPGEDGVPTGKLMVVRDNTPSGGTLVSTEIGVTLHVVNCATTTVLRVPSEYSTIQLAIDSAPYNYTANALGALILVAPGTYSENVIMNKPVRLQGAGPGSTFINGNPTPLSRLDDWHARIEPPVAMGGLNGQALEDYMLKNPFSENEAPGIIVMGEQFFPDGVIGAPIPDEPPLPTVNVFNPGFRFGTADDLVYTAADVALDPTLVEGSPRVPSNGIGAPIPGVAIPGQSLIDGFTLSGSKAGGGIYIFTRARGLQVSNNNITNNQGNYAGGLSVGVPDAGFQMFDEDDFRYRTAGFQNTDVVICNNKIHRNSGFQGAGGLALSEDSHRYLVKDNIIAGNFSRLRGGGIAHVGRSDGGVIKDNKIWFNELFVGAILARAGDGGGIYVGGDLAGGTGAGSMTIDGNLIQGNMTGAGRGGGIRVDAFNGIDVRSINDPDIICDASATCPDPWPLFTLTMTNNMIVNNIAGLDGGGISLQDVSRAVIANNTIANNDSTQVGLAAFPAGSLDSIPAPAGISSHPYSAVLVSLWQEAQGQPLSGTPAKVLEYCIFGSPFDIGGANANPSTCQGNLVEEPGYSDPILQNNIVWHNNAYWFDGGPPSTAGGPTGVLVFDSWWDHGVQNGAVGQVLHPLNSLDSTGGDPAFVSEYVNDPRAATVIDELGNNINIRFMPFPGVEFPALSGLYPVDESDYHITAASAALDTGAPVGTPTSFLPPIFYYEAGLGGGANDQVPVDAGWYNATNPLLLDIDDQDRVPAPGGQWDIGADEYLGVAGGGAGLLDACPANMGAFATAFGSLGGTVDYAANVDYDTDSDVDAGDLGSFSAVFNPVCP